MDVEGVIDATARRLLGGLDISVVLDDGTLVGKLAPTIDRQLSKISKRQAVLVGGGV